MKHLHDVGLLVILPLAAGCAARSAPFDEMDRAQVTILRLQQPQAQQALPAIPGVPPELAQMGQAALQGLQNVVPGLSNALPGFIPGAQPQQQQPQFKGFAIVNQAPVADEGLKEQILDIFGHESNFTNQVQPCFSPGMALVFQRPPAPEVDLLISLSCNQVKMDGAAWPHAVNGFTPQARDQLGKIFEKYFGPVPAGA